MKLYLVRHGQTDMNKEKLYYGWTDCPINEQGRKQARTLQRFFQNIKYDKIITSDLKRSIETAEIINNGRKIPFEKRKNFRELHFGSWEGGHYKILKEKYPDEFTKWAKDWKTFTIPEGESFQAFYQRVEKELNCIISQTPEDSTLLIVTHNGVMSVILCVLLGAGFEGFWKFFLEQETYSLVSIRKGNVLMEKLNCPILE